MATDPYAAIRNLQLNETPTYSDEFYSGYGEEDPASLGYALRDFGIGDSSDMRWTKQGAQTGSDYSLGLTPGQQAYQSKFNEVQMLPDGRMVATLQQPGAHKYDLMQAVYAKDPATGQWALQGDPSNFKQQSSKTSMLQGLGTGLATIGGMAVAGPLAGALGGGVLGAAGAGAILGGAKPLLSGGNSSDIGKGIVRGGATGAIVGGIGEYASAAPDLPSGMDLAADAGANGANSIGSAAAQFNTPDYSSGISNAAGQHAPLDDYYAGGGASDMSTGGQYAGQGGHPFAVGEGAGAEMLGMYPGSTTPFDPAETIEVTGKKLVAPTEPTDLPQADYSNEGRNYPTPESTQGPGGSPVNSSPVQAGIGSKIGDFFKANPRLAISLLGSVLGKAGGGSGSAPTTGGSGTQGGMTATQAPKFQRQYVAPPAGYRPGFDPEHKYFTGIGTSGTGG